MPPPRPADEIAQSATGSFSPWINRVGGYLVRAFSLAPFYVVAAIIAAILGDIGFIVVVLAWIVTIAAAARFFIQRAHLGYDVGDRVVGQQLVLEETNQPMGSGWSVFGRQIAHILDAIPCYVGFLWPLWDAKNQTFADKILKTVVVQENSSAQHSAADLWVNALMFWTPVIKS